MKEDAQSYCIYWSLGGFQHLVRKAFRGIRTEVSSSRRLEQKSPDVYSKSNDHI